MKKIMLIALLVVNGLLIRAQNNAIFSGGAADGWSRSGFAQAGTNIFAGGSADGWAYHGFAQATNTIYKGGEGDGWSFSTHQQAAVNIFTGGEGDGWSFNSFLQAGNDIFKGGGGDGWNYLAFLQTGTNIYLGGTGDGWASTYRPLGALPVTLLSFTAEKQGTSALLKWQTSKEEGADRFDVEKSSDAVRFEKIGTVTAAGNSNVSTNYSFTDVQPAKGYNYYRLKQVDRNGAFVYTPVRMVTFDVMTLNKLKAYPVPATTFLTMELPAQTQTENVVINLTNTLGVMVQQVKLTSNRASSKIVLNLGGLPAGAYTLQVSSVSFNGSQVIIKQ